MIFLIPINHSIGYCKSLFVHLNQTWECSKKETIEVTNELFPFLGFNPIVNGIYVNEGSIHAPHL